MFNFLKKKIGKQTHDEDYKKKTISDVRKNSTDYAKAYNNAHNSTPADGCSPEFLANQRTDRCFDPRAISRNCDVSESTSNSVKSVPRTDNGVSHVSPKYQTTTSYSAFNDSLCTKPIDPKLMCRESVNADKEFETQCQDSDRVVLRRNSKTNKEVVNLLLPEDSVKYKKDNSYLSKAGVQNLLDKMGRGKKKAKNEMKRNRTWSFGSNKMKLDEADAENCIKKRSSIDNTTRNEFKYDSINNSNVFTNISEDLSCAKINEVMDQRKQDVMRLINANFGDDQSEICESAEESRSSMNDLIDDILQPSEMTRSEVGAPRVIDTSMEEKSDAIVGSDSKTLTSSNGNSANRETGEGGRWYFGTEEEQYDAKRDTTRSPEVTSNKSTDRHKEQKPPESKVKQESRANLELQHSSKIPYQKLDEESVQESPVIENKGPLVPASDVSDKGENIFAQTPSKSYDDMNVPTLKQNGLIEFDAVKAITNDLTEKVSQTKNTGEFRDNSLDQDDENVDDLIRRITSKVKELKQLQLFEDRPQMGTTDSKQSGKNDDKYEKLQETKQDLPPSFYVQNDRPQKEPEPEDKKPNPQNFIIQDLVLKVENNSMKEDSDATELEDQKDKEKSVVTGSLNLEIMKMETITVEEPEKIETSNVDAPVETPIESNIKHILKEDKEERQTPVKKHVTFHNVIEFDDGDRIEDDGEDDSFESVDDTDEANHSVIQIELDSDDSLEEQQNQIIEFEDSSISSTSEDIIAAGNTNSELNRHQNDSKPEEDRDLLIIEELEVENDENAGCEGGHVSEDLIHFPNTEIEIKSEGLIEASSEEETGSASETEESEEEDSSEPEVDSKENNNKTVLIEVDCEQCKNKMNDASDVESDHNTIKQMYNQFSQQDKEDDNAYTELLTILEKQMRGLIGHDERLADLQERAAALHKVQNEVTSARKEAELVRQKLWHVEADLAATRCRNSQLLEHLEAKTEEAKDAEIRIKELIEKTAHLQELLDKLIPEHEQLKEKYKILKSERDEERKLIEETLAQAEEERLNREEWWKAEFEKLRSQGAEREELLLADCEWKLREVQQAAREKTTITEQRLRDLQRQADERCARADNQLAELAELRSLQAEVTQLRQAAREQQRALRMANERAAHAAQAESEVGMLRVLLDREKNALSIARAQHAKELEEKENRLITRLQEQAERLEKEWKTQIILEEQEKRVKEQQETCKVHEHVIKDAYDRMEILKSTLAKKVQQYEDMLERTKTTADWEKMELRRQLDKTEMKYTESIEMLEEKHAKEIEQLNQDMEKRIKDLETTLGSQVVSARTTLELVKGQLQAEHADNMHRLKEKYKTEIEKQWELFTNDKEDCLERMKAECILEGQEEKEKREKDLLQEIEVMKAELAKQEKDLSLLRQEARKSTEARTVAEKRLSEVQTACETREMSVRAEVTRQAEVAQREARETIDHLTKKCSCLTSLFEDMRSRWQQAPGEAAQLRKALQDEKAKSAALRRQLDALSRYHRGDDRALALVEKLLGEDDAASSSAVEDQRTNDNDQSNIHDDTTNDNKTDADANDDGFVTVSYSARKRKKKRPKSPPRPPVYLPPVTVPVRIRQFNARNNKNDSK